MRLRLQIARIRKLIQIGAEPEQVELEVTWFYRPEEAIGGRKVHSSPKIAISAVDTRPVRSLRRCTALCYMSASRYMLGRPYLNT